MTNKKIKCKTCKQEFEPCVNEIRRKLGAWKTICCSIECFQRWCELCEQTKQKTNSPVSEATNITTNENNNTSDIKEQKKKKKKKH